MEIDRKPGNGNEEMVTLPPEAERETPPKPYRRSKWRTYSLRTFLVIVTLLCVCLAQIVTSGVRQKRAKHELERLGVTALYEHEWDYSGKPQSFLSRTLVPWTSYVEPNFLLPVTVVRTHYLEAYALKNGAAYTSGDIIAPISRLTRLKTLDLTHSEITNKDIGALAGLSDLESLGLHMTRIREGPIPGLAQLKLRSLRLNRTRADDDSIAELEGMATLEHLDLTRTKVTDAGLKYLEALPNLRKLVLRRTLVTKAGYEEFKKTHPRINVRWESLKPR